MAREIFVGKWQKPPVSDSVGDPPCIFSASQAREVDQHRDFDSSLQDVRDKEVELRIEAS